MNIQNDKPVSLLWREDNGKKRKENKAGVAFYETDQNEYRLKVDMFPQSKRFYVKPVEVIDGEINYRVEVIERQSGAKRKTVGKGNRTYTGNIAMHIPPFEQKLVIKTKK